MEGATDQFVADTAVGTAVDAADQTAACIVDRTERERLENRAAAQGIHRGAEIDLVLEIAHFVRGIETAWGGYRFEEECFLMVHQAAYTPLYVTDRCNNLHIP